MSAGRRRHPVQGILGGLLLGIGIAMLLFLYGKIAFGTLTPYVIVLAGAILGLVWAYVAPTRGSISRDDDWVEEWVNGQAAGGSVAEDDRDTDQIVLPPPAEPEPPLPEPPLPEPHPEPEPPLPPPEPEPPLPAPEPEPEPEPEWTPPPPAAVTGFVATHLVPVGGVITYAGAEDGGRENGRLDAGLPVQMIDHQGDWAKVVCTNGWSAWVDARKLIPH